MCKHIHSWVFHLINNLFIQSRACQSRHWPEHKALCRSYALFEAYMIQNNGGEPESFFHKARQMQRWGVALRTVDVRHCLTTLFNTNLSLLQQWAVTQAYSLLSPTQRRNKCLHIYRKRITNHPQSPLFTLGFEFLSEDWNKAAVPPTETELKSAGYYKVWIDDGLLAAGWISLSRR